jgi:Flp pilus assembly pilin Flp
VEGEGPLRERPEHFPEKWAPVFRRKCDQRKNPERDGDSKKRHPALARFWRDTSCGTTIEYGFIVAGIALAIVLALEEIGADGRAAAREFFHTLRFSDP